MEPIVTTFRDARRARAAARQVPLFSTVLGRQVDGSEMTADYRATQLFTGAVL
jgi:hypothetical protein